MPAPEQALIVFNGTNRGFLFGEFRDANGTRCSIQESSLATAGAVWLGPNDSADAGLYSPNRMHLVADELNQLIGPLERFATFGQFPTEPITFRDYCGVPCCLSAANDQQILLGVVLPKQADGSPRVQHDSNLYGARGEEVRQATEFLFEDLRNGATGMIEVDNRMLLDRRLAKALIAPFRRMIADGEERSIK
jgi:hypothetical protein